MPKLDDLQRALDEKLRGQNKLDQILKHISERPSVEATALLTQIQGLQSQLATLQDEVFRLKKQPKITEGITKQFNRLEKGLDKMAALLKPEPVDFSPIVEGMRAMEAASEAHRKAVEAIEFPKQELPEYPAPPDIIPLIDGLNKVSQQVANLNDNVVELKNAPQPEERAPEEWDFDVKYAPGGAIRNVKAKQIR